MNTLSVMKAVAVAFAFAPVAAFATPTPAISYVVLTQGNNLDNLGAYTPSNGAFNAQPYVFDNITLPVTSTTASLLTLAGTIDYHGSTKPLTDIQFSNLSISVPDGVIYATVSKNGSVLATNTDLFTLFLGSSDLTGQQEFNFTADGHALYKIITGHNESGYVPMSTKTVTFRDGTKHVVVTPESFGAGGLLQGFSGPLPVAEPTAVALFGFGAGLLGLARRRAK